MRMKACRGDQVGMAVERDVLYGHGLSRIFLSSPSQYCEI